jgi:hypothetical protein
MSTRNISWGGGAKDGRCVGLTTLPPSYAESLEIWKPQPADTLRACPGLYRDCFTFCYPFNVTHPSGLCLSLPGGAAPCLPFGPHVPPPQSFFFISSLKQYIESSTNHEVLHYVISSGSLLPPPSWAQIFSTARYSRRPSVYIPPPTQEIKGSYP